MPRSPTDIDPLKAAAEREEELRRLIVRLTYGINEYDPGLLQLLTEMRSDMQAPLDIDRLRELRTDLGQHLSKDRQKSNEQSLLEVPLGLFRQILAAPRLDVEARKPVLDLAAEVVHEKGTLDATTWQRFIKQLNTSLDQAKHVDAPTPMAGSHRHVEATLIRILDNINAPPDELPKVEKLKQALKSGVTLEQLFECINDIARYVGKYRPEEGREREDIEGFLLEMKDHLKDMQGLIAGLMQSQQDTFHVSNRFGRALQKNIETIHSQVDAAKDIKVLKQEIKSSIQQISTTLEAFNDSVKQRQQLISSEMKQVNARMNALEIVSEVLKERLISERKMALQDPLTGIHNRLAYDERIEDEMERFLRYQTPFVLTVWDLDRFKGINDKYGHLAGDKVLQAMAEVLKANTRKVDFVARYGGEEFVVIIPNTSIAAAIKVADKIRQQVEKMRFHYNEQKVEVTTSCGLAEVRAGDSVSALFKRADDALYRAKKGGRNRCLVAE